MERSTPAPAVHNIPPVYNARSRVLILGSFPSVKSREAQFFYGHPQNRFWRVLAAVLGRPVPDSVAEKRALLLGGGVALWDVIAACEITGSSDSSIRNVEPADLERILAVTGRVAILCNGGMSYKLYRKYQESRLGIPAVQLPSTSPANAAWNLERLSAAWGEVLLPLLRKEEE